MIRAGGPRLGPRHDRKPDRTRFVQLFSERSVNRSSWLTIRAPLSPRRATVAKFASFLLPLLLWATICFLWVPEVVITEQGEGRYKPGDRLTRGQFDAENARILASRADSTFILTDRSFQSMRSAGVSESVLKKLDSRKDLKFENRKEFQEALSEELDKDELARFQARILDNAEKEEKPLAVGEPSNPIWLPSPLKVTRAFYYAFETPPVRGDPWLHQSLWHSCQIIFWGFILSAVVGVPLGVLCGTFDLFSKVTEPFIAIIWIRTFFQMVLVVANTTRQFDESLLEAAQTLGATKRTLLTKVILPGI